MSYLGSIMIVTKDRAPDLEATVRAVGDSIRAGWRMLVVDDGSTHPVGPMVRALHPDAVIVRHESSEGQSQRRSEAFRVCSGPFILQLDDDSCPADGASLERAKSLMQENPRLGALAFQVFNGVELPTCLPRGQAKFVSSFVGCGVMFRKEALEEIGGYRSFFGNEWEEEELGLRLLKAGWALYFFPEGLIHHRVSPVNRRTERTWMRGFRNKLWSMVMHYPLDRLLIEGTWTLTLACWDAIRLWRPGYLLRGLWEFVGGLPRAFRLRDPMSRDTMRLYDAVRFCGVYTFEEWQAPPRVRLSDGLRHLRSWLNRPRQRAVWDRREGDVGTAATVRFAHEKLQDQDRGADPSS